MKRYLLLALLVVTFYTAQAQQNVWTIEKCIDHALENNLQVKQGMTTVEMKRLGVEQAKFNYLPSLNANSGYTRSMGRSLDPTTYQFINNQSVSNVNAGLSLGIKVFGGMENLHSLRKSELNLMASIQDNERTKNDITISVAAAFLQILYSKEQVQNSRNQLVSIDSLLVQTKKLVDAGSRPLGSFLEIQAQMAAEQYNLVNYENQLANNILSLTQLLELRSTEGFDVQVPDVTELLTSASIAGIDSTYEKALSLPQITSAKLRRDIAEKDVLLAKAKLYPSLSFGANYGSSYSDARTKPQFAPDGSTIYSAYPFFEQFGDNASASLQLSLQIPIFNALSARRGVSQARQGLLSSEYSVAQEKNKLFKDIQQSYTDATGAKTRFQSAQVSVSSNEEAFRYAERKLAAGATTAVDYTTAKNNLLNAQSMMLQAKYEYIFRVKILDFYRGVSITL